MTNNKSTKRALVSSALAILLCVSMLIGTTFAWFTDTASTGVNKIQAGNLDVQLLDEENKSLEGKTLTWATADDRSQEDILWEPGCTYKLQPVVIKNNGTLALKYKVEITGIKGDAKLNEAIEWTINDTALENDHSLAAGATSDALTITGHMKENAGNEYQGLSIDGIAITVYATQDTVENDSFNNQYDKNATYSVVDYAGLKEKFAGSGVYNVTADVDVEDTLKLTGFNALTLNASGKTISNTNDIWNDSSWSLVSAQDNSFLTIAGGNFEAKENDCYAVDVQDGATVTIEDGTFVGNIHAVYVQQGTAYIKGGFYSVQQKYPQTGKENEFVLNCYDANRENGNAKIIVTGGTFVNFNPADCYAEGPHTNFVADGYKVVSEAQTNGDVWYTVVAE